MTAAERIEIVCQRLAEILKDYFEEPRDVAERAAFLVEQTRHNLIVEMSTDLLTPQVIQDLVAISLRQLADGIRRLS